MASVHWRWAHALVCSAESMCSIAKYTFVKLSLSSSFGRNAWRMEIVWSEIVSKHGPQQSLSDASVAWRHIQIMKPSSTSEADHSE